MFRGVTASIALILSVSAFAVQLPSAVIPRVKTVRELMINCLGDPSVQTRIHVTEAQRMMQSVRMSRESMKLALAMSRAFQSDEAAQGMNMDFVVDFGKNLFPYLAPNQISMLKRISIAKSPLDALGTDEVAFALDLSEGQRKSIEAMRIKSMAAYFASNRPSMKAFAQIMTDIAKYTEKQQSLADSTTTEERIQAFEVAVTKLYGQLENAVRLAAREKEPESPDPMGLLTTVQRKRFAELTGGIKG